MHLGSQSPANNRPPAIGAEKPTPRHHHHQKGGSNSFRHPPRSIHEADGKSDTGGGGGESDSEWELSQSTPPACLRWAESLDTLLDDSDGVALLKRFLEQESCANLLDFWFACQGFKHSVPASESSKIYQLIKVIYRTYVRGGGGSGEKQAISIKPETRKGISERISRKQGLDQGIFDHAQMEVEHSLRHSLYPTFLNSDVYIQYVQRASGGKEPLIDSMNDDPLYHKLVAYPDGPPNKLAEHCSATAAIVVASQQPNLPTLDEDCELKMEDVTASTGSGGTGSHQKPAPLTTENLLVSRFYRAELSYRRPEAVAGAYLQREAPSRPPNPYHVSYAPVSQQDSELQSLSSDAHTDDTRSQTDSSLDGSHGLHSRKQWKHQRRAMRRSAQHNRELNGSLCPTTAALIPRTQHPGCGDGVGGDGNMRGGKERNLAEVDPVGFVRQLTERLQALLDDRAKMERIETLLNQTNLANDLLPSTGASSIMPPPSTLPHQPPTTSSAACAVAPDNTAALFKQPWAGRLMAAAMDTKNTEDAQAILEDHCSRIWAKSAEQTPPTGTLSPAVVALHQHNHRHHMHSHSHQHSGYQHTMSTSMTTSSSSTTMLGGGELVQHHNHHHLIQSQQQQQGTSSNKGTDKVRAWIYENSCLEQQQSGHHRDRSLGGHHRSSSRNGPRGQQHRHSPGPTTVSQGHDTVSNQNGAGSRSRPLGSNRSSPPCHQQPALPAHVLSGPGMGGVGDDGNGLIVGYYMQGDPVPYRTNWPAKEINLGQFKQLIAKKGNYRFFFKKACDEFETGVVQEEISNDEDILPLWEGKIVAKVERTD